ncbi:hypothetical protein TNCV_726521 [Trichonephila clavipes]|nr:hypothetical protein TNCV_726521 [Trichonephila clavipes]
MNLQIEHQLVVLVCGINKKILCYGKLLGMFPMKGQTTGSELLSSLIHLCDAASLNINSCVSITTDGAKSMIGTKIGMVTLLKEHLAHCGVKLWQLHCIIHQENLCGRVRTLALMHLFATNIAAWIRLLLWEGMKDWEVAVHIKHNSSVIWDKNGLNFTVHALESDTNAENISMHYPSHVVHFLYLVLESAWFCSLAGDGGRRNRWQEPMG